MPAKAITIDSTLRLYRERDPDSSVVAQLPKGAAIELGSATVVEGREWIEATVEDKVGYVLGPSVRGHTTLTTLPETGEPLRDALTRKDRLDSSKQDPLTPNILSVLNHGGAPRDKELVFFSPPPHGIGRLLSANSSLRPSDIAGARRFDGGLLGFLRKHSPKSIRLCTYVGEDGVALAVTRDAGTSVVELQEMSFYDAVSLWAHETVGLTNGRYTGTRFCFRWVDELAVRFTIAGSHGSKFALPPSDHHVHFARAAERAWTSHYLKQWRAVLDAGGAFKFDHSLYGTSMRFQANRVRTSEAIRVTKDYIEGAAALFPRGFRWSLDEIESVDVENGLIRMMHRHARELPGGPKNVEIPYRLVSNALALVTLTRNLIHTPPK